MVFLLIVAFGKAQIVTNCGGNPGTSTDGSHKWDVCRIELYKDKVYVQFEITALKPIRRLNIYDDYGYLIYGREEEREGIGMKGLVNNNEIKYFGSNSNWGWDKIGRGEKVYYTLCYGGGGNNGNSIPSGATTISIYGVGVEIDGILGEFNIPPCTSKEEYVDSIKYMKNWIKNYVKNIDPNLDICCKATMLVPEDQLLDPLANEIGCDPDFNAYTMDKNPKPEGYSNCLRVAGEMIARKYGNIF